MVSLGELKVSVFWILVVLVSSGAIALAVLAASDILFKYRFEAVSGTISVLLVAAIAYPSYVKALLNKF